MFDANLTSQFHLLGDPEHGELATPPVYIAFDCLFARCCSRRDADGTPPRAPCCLIAGLGQRSPRTERPVEEVDQFVRECFAVDEPEARQNGTSVSLRLADGRAKSS